MTSLVEQKSLTEIKNGLADVVAKAQQGIATVGLNRGKRAVAIVPVEVLDKYMETEARELRDMIHGREDEETTVLADELDAVTDKLQAGPPA
ncbi:prevent-host-death family protein [Streptomyces solisilvae]|uniref:prevent-host-death family protein n=1 Tax=Streptomyces malaysiensis TaxID=92644 RepID=UPI00367CC0B9